MGRFDGILICSDVDGTLAEGKNIPENNLEALRYFQSEGGLFTLATGRPAGYESVLGVPLNAPVITENGTRIYDSSTGHTLWTYPLDGAWFLLEWIDQNVSNLVTLHFTDGVSPAEVGTAVLRTERRTTGDLLKIVISNFPEGEDSAAALRDRMAESFGSRFSIFRSWGTGVEVISPLGGKGRCLQHLKELLGDRARVTVGVGDYENDLSLLRSADLSYAPANSCPEVLAFAKNHLPPCSQGAIAALIEDLDCKLSRGELCL